MKAALRLYSYVSGQPDWLKAAPTRSTTGPSRRGRVALRRTGRFRPRRAGRQAARAGGPEYLHRRQLVEVRRMARPDLFARPLSFARPLLAQAIRGRMSARIRRNI